MSGPVIAANGLLEVLDRANGLERAGNDLGGPGAMDFVGELAFEQLGVRQDDAELVVQAVKKTHHLGRTGVRRYGR